MQRRTYLLVSSVFAVMALIGLTSCDKVLDASSIGVPITVNFTAEAANATVPLVSEACADLTTKKAFNDNISLISGGTASDVTMMITELANPTFTSGTLESQIFTSVKLTLSFDPSYGDTRTYTLGEFTNVSLSQLMSGKRSLVLHSDANEAIAKMKTQPKFCVTTTYGPLLSGPARADKISATIDMTLKFEARVL